MMKTNLSVITMIFVVGCFAAGSAESANGASSFIDEQQVVEINRSLKNIIEENQSLSSKAQQLETRLQGLQQDAAVKQDTLNDVRRERDSLAASVEKARQTSRQYQSEVQKLREDLESLNSTHQMVRRENDELQDRLADFSRRHKEDVFYLASAEDITTEDVRNREDKTLDLLTKIDAFTETDDRLREDAAKAHYNMGNIYFQQGEHEIAAREYYQAVTLMPNDPDAHYNLAFVSGEYLNDQVTALKHYQMYVYLAPNAKDVHLVREKIVKSQLLLKGKIKSPLEKVTDDRSLLNK